jgi:hypothetical protein
VADADAGMDGEGGGNLICGRATLGDERASASARVVTAAAAAVTDSKGYMG